MMSSDVPLSDAGYQRAEKLKALLAGKNMVAIYSTQTKRTVSTALPLSELLQVPVQFYSHRDTLPAFIERVRKVKKGTVLIVGHSNTVDDLVNQLMNQSLLQDLPETEYDNLFLVTRKGTKWYLRRKKY
jgi:broad specificity phosphatase PhoE